MSAAAAAAAASIVRSSSEPSFNRGRSSTLGFLPSELHSSVYSPNGIVAVGRRRRRRGLVVRTASSSSDTSESGTKIGPLKLVSPIGQLLSQMLISHPHLVPTTVEQHLERLRIERDADEQKEEPSASGTDFVLRRRITEIKANERRKALEEILYALVVQKFMDANIPLTPPITIDPSGQVNSWPSQDGELEQFHSAEVCELIQTHLHVLLDDRLSDSTLVAQISKFRVGEAYAASILYGYFLKQVDQRLQLEKTVRILPQAEQNIIQQIVEKHTEDSSRAESHPEVATGPGGSSHDITLSRLLSYVMSMDYGTVQGHATIRSKEVVSIVEKHTEALFEAPGIGITPFGAIDSSKDEKIKISSGGMKRLLLEAITFGSFLWDVESYVDSKYHFVLN